MNLAASLGKFRGSALFLGAFALLALSGCAAMHWEKAGTDTAQAERDFDQCQQKAALSARRLASSSGQFPTIVGGPGGSVTVMTPAFGGATDLGAQQSMLSDCMRARGYRLARDE